MALNTQNNLISNLSHDEEDEIGCGPEIRLLPMMTRSHAKSAKAEINEEKTQAIREREIQEEQTHDTSMEENKDVVMEDAEVDSPILPEEDLAKEQRLDPLLLEIIDYLVEGRLPRAHSRARYVKSVAHQYIINSKGILRKIDVPTHEQDDLPPAMLPRQMWDEVLEA